MQVLLIAYHFPPIGGAGTQRSAKFAKYLPAFGITPVVVAGPAGRGGRWEPTDSSQLSDLPDGISIYRAETPAHLSDEGSRRQRLLGTPTPDDMWWQRQIREQGRFAAADHDIDAIVVSLQPYAGLEPALELAAALHVPIVADLRDPWALDEVRAYPSLLHRQIDTVRMGRLLERCSMVLANTQDASNAIAKAFPRLADRVRVITNGYDSNDFVGVAPPDPNDAITIVHTGYLHSALGIAEMRRARLRRSLGGRVVPVNMLARSHYYLLQAIEELHGTTPDLAARVRIVLAGVASPDDEDLVAKSPVRGQVELLGYIDHRDSIKAMIGADILFLPQHGVPSSYRARIVPGKTYEYLASGRPILAAVPGGDTRDLIEEFDAGVVVDPTDVSGIARAVAELATPWEAVPAPRKGTERFERRRLAERLAALLAEVTGAPPG